MRCGLRDSIPNIGLLGVSLIGYKYWCLDKGDRAIPQVRRFLQKFPDPQSLAQANYSETVPFFEKLGLLRRTRWVIELAKQWLTDPPVPDVVRKKLYGGKVRFESEVAHLKGVGTYASDAWRTLLQG